MKTIPHNKPTRLHNVICVYCRCELSQHSQTVEHVIGRRFVPKGNLNGQWNLIVRACETCNGRKADLEDELSAITLHPDATGRYAYDDAGAIEDARRKARGSRSRKTKARVSQSQELVTLRLPIGGGLGVTLQFAAAPQAEKSRVYELAQLQVAAFFFFITYDDGKQRGSGLPYGCHPVDFSVRGDWGNRLMRSFMTAVVGWRPRVVLHTARGYFRIIIRRHPSAVCWSWALEWNQGMRVIGFFGDRSAAKATVDGFELAPMRTLAQGVSGSIRFRDETPLRDEDDIMFAEPE